MIKRDTAIAFGLVVLGWLLIGLCIVVVMNPYRFGSAPTGYIAVMSAMGILAGISGVVGGGIHLTKTTSSTSRSELQ